MVLLDVRVAEGQRTTVDLLMQRDLFLRRVRAAGQLADEAADQAVAPLAVRIIERSAGWTSGAWNTHIAWLLSSGGGIPRIAGRVDAGQRSPANHVAGARALPDHQ